MEKGIWKPGNMLYPLPAVLVSAGDEKMTNLLTVAWTGTVCSDPAMLSVSIRPERFTYGMIKKTGEFAVNLTTTDMVRQTDFCGVRSGRDTDKWKETGLTREKAATLTYAPLVSESPVSIECKVKDILELGSHHMFLAEVTAVRQDEKYVDEEGRFRLDNANLLAYSHGTYYSLGREIGKFGFSVRKKP